jgi:hypothetical protein
MTPEEIAAAEEAKKAEFDALNEQLTSLAESVKGIESQIQEISKPAEIAPDTTPEPDRVPETWNGLREEMRTEAEKIADEKLAAKEEEQRIQKETEKAEDKKWNDKYDEEAAKAVELGYLPAVQDEKDHNDPGNASRRDLFGFAHFMGQSDLLKVAETVKMYNDNGKHFDVDQGKWIQSEYRVPGKTAPVGSSANRVSTGSNAGTSYKERHNMSMDMLARKAKAKYGIE